HTKRKIEYDKEFSSSSGRAYKGLPTKTVKPPQHAVGSRCGLSVKPAVLWYPSACNVRKTSGHSIAFSKSSSFPRLRPTRTTEPYLATSNAVARPIPEVRPVTTHALRFDGLFMEMWFDILIFFRCLSSQSSF